MSPRTRALVALAICMLLSETANVLLKTGIDRLRFDPARSSLLAEGLRAARSPWILAGLAVYASGVLAWFVVLASHRYSSAQLFFSAHYLLVLVSATLIFRETLTLSRIAGALLIVAGVALVTRSEG